MRLVALYVSAVPCLRYGFLQAGMSGATYISFQWHMVAISLGGRPFVLPLSGPIAGYGPALTDYYSAARLTKVPYYQKDCGD